MSIETCFILLDSTPFMRNGDYAPTRLSAQEDAARSLLSGKLNMRPENTVGMATFHGKGTSLLVSATNNRSKLLSALHGVQPSHGSGGDVLNALQTAFLALKYRKTAQGVMRIVLFLGSPIVGVSAPALKKLGETLRKGNVRGPRGPRVAAAAPHTHTLLEANHLQRALLCPPPPTHTPPRLPWTWCAWGRTRATRSYWRRLWRA